MLVAGTWAGLAVLYDRRTVSLVPACAIQFSTDYCNLYGYYHVQSLHGRKDGLDAIGEAQLGARPPVDRADPPGPVVVDDPPGPRTVP